jgi:hypothetical protein
LAELGTADRRRVFGPARLGEFHFLFAAMPESLHELGPVDLAGAQRKNGP